MWAIQNTKKIRRPRDKTSRDKIPRDKIPREKIRIKCSRQQNVLEAVTQLQILRNTENDLSLLLRKTYNGQKAMSFRGCKLWNNLELHIKQAPSLATFKKNLKVKFNAACK